jgi:hypothetical protein
MYVLWWPKYHKLSRLADNYAFDKDKDYHPFKPDECRLQAALEFRNPLGVAATAEQIHADSERHGKEAGAKVQKAFAKVNAVAQKAVEDEAGRAAQAKWAAAQQALASARMASQSQGNYLSGLLEKNKTSANKSAFDAAWRKWNEAEQANNGLKAMAGSASRCVPPRRNR